MDMNSDDNISMTDSVLSSDMWPPSSPTANPTFESTLQKRLHDVLDGTHEPWTYAILWKPSYNDSSGESVLKWGDGYYNDGVEEMTRRKKGIPLSPAEKERRIKVIRELRSVVCSEAVPVDENDDDEEVTDTQWFFLVSMTWSFGNGSGLAGKAFTTNSVVWVTGSDQIIGSGCERDKKGGFIGLQTIVCIPTNIGVLELGSTELIHKTSDLFNKIRFLFNYEGSTASSSTSARAPSGDDVEWSAENPNPNSYSSQNQNDEDDRLAGRKKIDNSVYSKIFGKVKKPGKKRG